jgi:hypothetical protein
LPDATTMSPNQNAFSIRNIGEYPISIEDYTGNSIGGVPAGSQVECGLDSITTSAGVWVLNQNASYSTEVSQVKTGFFSHTFTVRLSTTKFAIIGTNAGTTGFSIQGFTLSGDVITSGTLTNVRTAAATFIEAKAIDSNRVVISYYSGATIFAIIADLTSIASPTIGTEATISTVFANNISLLFKFDVKPINDIGYYESNLTYSGRLTGTNIFVLLYGTTTGGETNLQSFNCGASGSTITVGTALTNTALGGLGDNNYIFIGALSISSSTVGYAYAGSTTSVGEAGAFTASYSAGTWTANYLSVTGVGSTYTGSVGMRGGSTLLYFATRNAGAGADTGINAIQFPSSGGAAPTKYQCLYTTQSNMNALILTATGAVALFLTNSAMQGFIYTPSTSLTSSVFSTAFSISGALTSYGYIDTTTCNTSQVGISASNYRFLMNFTAGSIIGKNLNNGSQTLGFYYGFAGSTNNFAVAFQNLDGSYQKIIRGTLDASLNFTPTKNLGWNKFLATGQSFSVRYCYQLGKYLINFVTQNQIVTPMSSSSTNGFLGESGFRDYQVSKANLTSTTNAGQDIDSSRVVWVQTQSSGDVTSDLPIASSGTNVRFSLLRIANT